MMTNWWQKFSQQRSLLLTILIFSCWGGNTNLTQAQVIPDDTLGNEASVVNQINETLQQIEGGALRGENLFHSFLEFSINEGNAVYFSNPADVLNIFSRVTGTNISQILGKLGVLGDANLYLLNPNGILFGPNAQLDIAGSFFANSGSGFILPNGVEYSATNPQAPPLLTVNTTAPVGLKLEGSEGIITNQAQLTAGNNLTLGGNQVINEGSLTAVNGTVNIVENATNSSNNSAVALNTSNQTANPRLQPDTSLGNENTEIEAIDENNDRVIGGAERGVNLFHSFGEFNIETGKGVYFANPEGIENILARVTGNNISEIRGTLGVEGIADLYFINPNGIFFNQNASLDLNGSFLASTAETVIFDEFEYSAVNPNIPPIIVGEKPPYNPPKGIGNSPNPTGLRFGENSGDIRLQNEEPPTPTGNLAVNPGETLALIGGNVTIDGVEITSPGSNIEIGGLNQEGIVNINPDLSISFPQGINRGDVSLINSTVLDVAGNDGGSINLNAQNLDVNDSQVLAGIGEGNGFENAQAGDIRLDVTETLEVENSSIFNDVNSNAVGNSGRIVIDTATLSLTNGGEISARTDGEGDAGGVQVTASEGITLDGERNDRNPSLIMSRVNPGAVGNSGRIVIDTSTLSLTKGGRILAITFGEEDAGLVQVTATEGITIDGERSSGSPSLIFSVVARGAEGNSEGIVIDTTTLSLTNGGRISSLADGEGDGGLVRVTASGGITIDGTLRSNVRRSSAILSIVNRGVVANSGGIVIETTTLSLTNGGLISGTTFGEGNAGLVQITATEGITVDGERSDGRLPTLITSQVNDGAVGKSEGILIDTTTLSLTNGGQISASTLGEGDAGRVQINATEGITLDGETRDGFPSRIVSQVNPDAEGKSGGILIDTSTLSLTNGGEISASTLGKGDAGAVQINATEGITLDGEKSDGISSLITSTVGFDAEGNSGEIVIDTTKLSLTNGGIISASTFGSGNGGLVRVTASGGITIDGEASDGKPSAILSVVDDGVPGRSGGISIDTTKLTINGGRISSKTAGSGNTGSVRINATESIILSSINSENPGLIENTVGEGFTILITELKKDREGNIEKDKTGNPITVVKQVEIADNPEATGNGSGVFINTQTLSLTEGAKITTSTRAFGNAGQIEINATEIVSVDGEFSDEVSSLISSNVAENAQGNLSSEGILINTNKLELTNGGGITATTFGEGDAGIITINATESISLNGQTSQGVSSLIASEVGSNAKGNGEEITLNTNQLLLDNNAQITSKSDGAGDAGNIIINAPNLVKLDNNSSLTVETDGSGKPGKITINSDTVNIGKDTQISATVKQNSTNTEGEGKININASNLNISGQLGIFVETEGIAPAGNLIINPYNNNRNLNIEFTKDGFISARTSNIGDGGSITITAPETIDIQGLGSITAETAGSGNAGNIELTANTITIAENTQLSVIATETATGKAGEININATKLNLDNATIKALTEGEGNPGSIIIGNGQNNANQVNLTNNSIISTEINAEGNPDALPANITIKTDKLSLDESTITASTISNRDGGKIEILESEEISLNNNSEITAFTQGSGNAGNIFMNASDNITIDKNSILNVETDNSGEAGEINITSNTLTIGKNSELSAKTTINATGDAGSITINANILDITGKLGIFAETDGVADAGSLNINPNDNPNLNITFFDEGQISASTSNAGDGGDININAPQTIDLKGNGTIKVETTGSGFAGDINFKSQQLNISEGVTISALTDGKGEAGSINLNIDDEILIDSGTTFTVETDGEKDAGDIELTANRITIGEDAELSAKSTANATGEAGDIILNTNQLTVFGEKGIFAETQGEGEGGSITINPLDDNLTLQIGFFDNGIISASTTASGDGGNIDITNSVNLTISGEGKIAVETTGDGKAGIINLSTEELTLKEGVKVTASTFATGNSGNINLLADNIYLDNAKIQAITSGSGKGGNINIPNTENLNLVNNSEIIASTSGEGKAGSIDLNVSQAVTIDRDSELKVETENIGDAGDIEINTPTLTIGENAELSARSKKNATGIAGNITLNTNQLNISGELGIFAETEGVADAGNLTINPKENNPNLTISFITNKGNISASTFGDGNGGDINITAEENISISGEGVISVKTEGSGFAGTINLETQNLNLTNGIEINASTFAEGKAGKINLSATNINLNQAEVNAVTNSTGNAGNINFFADNINLDNAKINALTTNTGDGGNINILNTENLNLVNNSEISASTSGEGKAGSIDLNVNQAVNIDRGSELKVETESIGDAGDIEINTPTLTIGENAELSARSKKNATGEAGNITLNTNQLNISGDLGIFAETEGIADAGNLTINPKENNPNLTISFITNKGNISASTFGDGNGGDINIIAPENINISGDGIISVQTSGSGNAGNINIITENLNLDEDIEISASTSGEGKAGEINLDIANNLNLNQNSVISSAALKNASGDGGNINIKTPKIDLDNQSVISVSSDGLVSSNAGEINIDTRKIEINNKSQISGSTSGGIGGNININATELIIENKSKIITTTSGKSQAGNIKLIISEEVKISGFETGIFADTTPESTGKGGNITLQTPELLIENDGIIAVDSLGEGEGGNITITNQNLTLNQGAISAETTSGDGGNINLTVNEFLTLRNNSQISTTAGKKETGGDGGNINIFARYIWAIPEENSDITANAFTGKGGQISITTETIFGIEPRDQLTLLSDITASSELGVDGIIEITRLNVDPLEGLTNLPSTPVEVKVAQGCQVGGKGSISFYDLGKGGLPAQPGDYLTDDSIITPWIELTIDVEAQSWNLENNNSLKVSDSHPKILFSFSCRDNLRDK